MRLGRAYKKRLITKKISFTHQGETFWLKITQEWIRDLKAGHYYVVFMDIYGNILDMTSSGGIPPTLRLNKTTINDFIRDFKIRYNRELELIRKGL